MGLLDIRDELAATRDLVGCLYLACQGMQAADERRALSAVSCTVRDKLATIDQALQDLIGTADLDAGWKNDCS